MKLILNKTINSSERYTLISGSMGSYGEPITSINHKYSVGIGVDRGNGYQGYMSVSYALDGDRIPPEAQTKIRSIIEKEGLTV